MMMHLHSIQNLSEFVIEPTNRRRVSFRERWTIEVHSDRLSHELIFMKFNVYYNGQILSIEAL